MSANSHYQRELRVIIGQKTEDVSHFIENLGKQMALRSPFVFLKAGNNRKYNQHKRKWKKRLPSKMLSLKMESI